MVDVQSFLHQLMVEKGINRSQLAKAMGVSRARVSQIFSDECKNFTIRLLARAVHALGEVPEINLLSAQFTTVNREGAECHQLFAEIEFKSSSGWNMGVANDDDVDWRQITTEKPDRRLSAALTDHAQRTQNAPRMAAYA
ncbi:helix-turn-helix transcriptional regulator [Novosphingobium sp. Chol11]|uniref:helix-turn-helix domain-containing protein n=1 Tax=Novosphingobium sp. Chol11 TaxID=1385763 RepID=UPI0025DE1252|nr:helix-turn-helix transcriptional regulator [Novosphingobium sp. Chol11]